MPISPAASTVCAETARNLCAVGLFAEDEINRFIQSLGSHAEVSAAQLMEALVNAGRLTSFQVQEILEGRIKDLVVGKYEILARLGSGGMGTVFKARHRRMKRTVALKVMSKQ